MQNWPLFPRTHQLRAEKGNAFRVGERPAALDTHDALSPNECP